MYDAPHRTFAARPHDAPRVNSARARQARDCVFRTVILRNSNDCQRAEVLLQTNGVWSVA
jgi:hypothetical protein